MLRILSLLLLPYLLFAQVKTGLEVLFEKGNFEGLKGKRIGLVTNHTGVDSKLRRNVDLFQEKKELFTLAAIFFPEHGFNGEAFAEENLKSKTTGSIAHYSLHGSHHRPTAEMLKGIDVLVYDIQEIGSRTYTYATTLYYVMEEAAKHHIPVLVLDRPNPMGGNVLDGPMLKANRRSFVGYINIPYCHGMTIGELASYFNEEYGIHCELKVIAMEGWERNMVFQNTGLPWIPTSPNIPEPDTPFFYATTGILGTMDLVNIGIGCTLPFKVVGAPWIEAEAFAKKLNDQKMPGVYFLPFHYKPFYGKYANELCQGVKIYITSYSAYKPLAIQYLILGILKILYPEKVNKAILNIDKARFQPFCQASGNDDMLKILKEEKYVAWKLIRFDEEERQVFATKRKKYLLY